MKFRLLSSLASTSRQTRHSLQVSQSLGLLHLLAHFVCFIITRITVALKFSSYRSSSFLLPDKAFQAHLLSLDNLFLVYLQISTLMSIHYKSLHGMPQNELGPGLVVSVHPVILITLDCIICSLIHSCAHQYCAHALS